MTHHAFYGHCFTEFSLRPWRVQPLTLGDLVSDLIQPLALDHLALNREWPSA